MVLFRPQRLLKRLDEQPQRYKTQFNSESIVINLLKPALGNSTTLLTLAGNYYAKQLNLKAKFSVK